MLVNVWSMSISTLAEVSQLGPPFPPWKDVQQRYLGVQKRHLGVQNRHLGVQKLHLVLQKRVFSNLSLGIIFYVFKSVI